MDAVCRMLGERTPIVLLAAALAGMAPPPVAAHDVLPAPKYAGFVLEASEIFFEVAAGPEQLLVYVEEDGRPVPTDAMTGEVRPDVPGHAQAVAVKPAGGNRLVAELRKPPRGTPLAFDVLLSPKDRVAFRFVVR